MVLTVQELLGILQVEFGKTAALGCRHVLLVLKFFCLDHCFALSYYLLLVIIEDLDIFSELLEGPGHVHGAEEN